jgi:hypothetical protein
VALIEKALAGEKLYDYVMQKVGESWRIDGVFPVAEDELSA